MNDNTTIHGQILSAAATLAAARIQKLEKVSTDNIEMAFNHAVTTVLNEFGRVKSWLDE